MLENPAVQRLTEDLAASLASMGIHSGEFGKPELVEKHSHDAEQLFQGYAKAKPSTEDAYAAASAFLRGQELSVWQRDLVASAVAEPIREYSGATVLAAKRFGTLLSSYETEARRGDLWQLTWYGLLYSYFNFDLEKVSSQDSLKGWEILRAFLERTWPLIDRQGGKEFIPVWMQSLRQDSAVLTANPAEKYAMAFLQGDTEPTDRLSRDLGIPPSSWFWHALVLGAVRGASAKSDKDFRNLVPQLIALVQGKPGFRDEAIEVILNRYHGCKGAPPDEQLRDFVCQPTVWKNPKLKAAGIATSWNRVSEPVWQMVLGWVNERNLKDFFDILAARNNADEGRLAFWSKYLKQITWTRLVFGTETLALRRGNAAVRELIAREEGAYAMLTAKPEVDAFMMRVGMYLIIEFSKKPNACYVYEADQLPFEPYSRYYDGGSRDLAAGYRGTCALRIVHRDGWAWRAEQDLRQLGIAPDVGASQQLPTSGLLSQATGVRRTERITRAIPAAGARSSAVPDLLQLHSLLTRFRGAFIDDRRSSGNGGRLWVEDPLQRAQLGAQLRALGFKWANGRQAWYFPEA